MSADSCVKTFDENVEYISCSPNQKLFAVILNGQKLVLYRVPFHKLWEHTFSAHHFTGVTWQPDSLYICLFYTTEEIQYFKLIDIKSGKPSHDTRIKAPNSYYWCRLDEKFIRLQCYSNPEFFDIFNGSIENISIDNSPIDSESLSLLVIISEDSVDIFLMGYLHICSFSGSYIACLIDSKFRNIFLLEKSSKISLIDVKPLMHILLDAKYILSIILVAQQYILTAASMIEEIDHPYVDKLVPFLKCLSSHFEINDLKFHLMCTFTFGNVGIDLQHFLSHKSNIDCLTTSSECLETIHKLSNNIMKLSHCVDKLLCFGINIESLLISPAWTVNIPEFDDFLNEIKSIHCKCFELAKSYLSSPYHSLRIFLSWIMYLKKFLMAKDREKHKIASLEPFANLGDIGSDEEIRSKLQKFIESELEDLIIEPMSKLKLSNFTLDNLSSSIFNYKNSFYKYTSSLTQKQKYCDFNIKLNDKASITLIYPSLFCCVYNDSSTSCTVLRLDATTGEQLQKTQLLSDTCFKIKAIIFNQNIALVPRIIEGDLKCYQTSKLVFTTYNTPQKASSISAVENECTDEFSIKETLLDFLPYTNSLIYTPDGQRVVIKNLRIEKSDL